jgi:hypothetical protein
MVIQSLTFGEKWIARVDHSAGGKMNRRTAIWLLTTFFLTIASLALAQQPKKVWRLGYLSNVDAVSESPRAEAIRLALRERGYIEGQNVIGGPLVNVNQQRIVDFALKSQLPSTYVKREFVDAGGLMYYGADVAEGYQRVAYFVDRILTGTKPAELTVEQPMRFEFVINLKSAKQIRLTIPQWTLMKATKVIQ